MAWGWGMCLGTVGKKWRGKGYRGRGAVVGLWGGGRRGKVKERRKKASVDDLKGKQKTKTRETRRYIDETTQLEDEYPDFDIQDVVVESDEELELHHPGGTMINSTHHPDIVEADDGTYNYYARDPISQLQGILNTNMTSTDSSFEVEGESEDLVTEEGAGDREWIRKKELRYRTLLDISTTEEEFQQEIQNATRALERGEPANLDGLNPEVRQMVENLMSDLRLNETEAKEKMQREMAHVEDSDMDSPANKIEEVNSESEQQGSSSTETKPLGGFVDPTLGEVASDADEDPIPE
ncbi:hypothetical protein AAMO2058_001115200 [Amorphochlora amoebiformis]